MRVKPEVIAFTGGEVGSQVLARVDLANYVRFAEIMENIFPDVQGKMSKAPGTIYIGEAPDAGAVLRPFEYSVSDNLVMVLSNEDFRLISGTAYVQLEGAAATIGTYSDESAAPPSGGGSPPDFGDYGGYDIIIDYYGESGFVT